MKSVRVWFEKKGAIQYVSHLDLTRCMSRGLKLSGLPVWYTEGLNPRIYMTYAMPLSLGVRGERECMEIRLTEDVPYPEIVTRLNEHLPGDLRVLEVTDPVDSFDDIAFGQYDIFLSPITLLCWKKNSRHSWLRTPSLSRNIPKRESEILISNLIFKRFK